MATRALVSINEYLSTSYTPDCDYVDGVLEERNLGENDHADLQTAIAIYLGSRQKQWGIYVVVEQRVQVSPTRFRIPDVCVVAGGRPNEQIFRTPPFICIEILSQEDRLSRVRERVNDYLSFGVPFAWLLDPATRKAFRWTEEGMHEVNELRTQKPEIVVPVAALFEWPEEHEASGGQPGRHAGGALSRGLGDCGGSARVPTCSGGAPWLVPE